MTKKKKKIKSNIITLEDKKKVKLKEVKKEEKEKKYVLTDVKLMRLEKSSIMIYSPESDEEHCHIPKNMICHIMRHYQKEIRDEKSQAVKANQGYFIIINAIGIPQRSFFFEQDMKKRDKAFDQIISWANRQPNILNTIKKIFAWLTGIGREFKIVEVWTSVNVEVKENAEVKEDETIH